MRDERRYTLPPGKDISKWSNCWLLRVKIIYCYNGKYAFNNKITNKFQIFRMCRCECHGSRLPKPITLVRLVDFFSWVHSVQFIHHISSLYWFFDFCTLIFNLAWQGNDRVMEMLLFYGASCDHACKQGATALGISAQEGHEKCVQILLQYGANPNKSDLCGRTPVKLAMKSNNYSILRLLESALKSEFFCLEIFFLYFCWNFFSNIFVGKLF